MNYTLLGEMTVGLLGGLLLLAALLFVYYLLGCAGWMVFDRLRQVYRLHTICHYLKQLEDTGRWKFDRPDKDNP